MTPSGNSAPVASFQDVSKWYGPVIAVNGVSAELGAGITGLVGSNGAGKSSFIRLLTGQTRPNLGKVAIRGVNAWSARAKSHIGYCADYDSYYEEMSGRSFVQLIASYHGFSRAASKQRTTEVLKLVDMLERADRPLRGYSKGMRQRIKLAQSLVHDPDLLVLDEPLNGVDPVGRRQLVDLFRKLAADGKTLLISSHVLEELDVLADQVLFMWRGRILASGPVDSVRQQLNDYPRQVVLEADRPRELATALMSATEVESIQFKTGAQLELRVRRYEEFLQKLAVAVVDQQFVIGRLETIDASTEAVFQYLLDKARKF